MKASLGEGRGEVKGDAVEDFALDNAGGMTAKPCDEAGLAPVKEGEPKGVVALGICHGAGEPRRKKALRLGGDVAGGSVVSL